MSQILKVSNFKILSKEEMKILMASSIKIHSKEGLVFSELSYHEKLGETLSKVPLGKPSL